RRCIVRNNIALDAPLAHRREVVACRPSPRCKFFPEQIASCSEPLEGNFAIAVIFVAHNVKIVLPAPDRQVGTPPVFHSLILDMAAGLETSHLVRAAAERYLERGFVEPTGSIIAAREDRGAQPRTAARRELDGPRNVPPRSRHRALPRRRSRAAFAGRS